MRGCSARTAGFVEMLAGAGKNIGREAEENNLTSACGRFDRWYSCSLCEQKLPAVHCALGWACWKMCVGRSEVDCLVNDNERARTRFGAAEHHEDALNVRGRVVYGRARCQTQHARRESNRDLV